MINMQGVNRNNQTDDEVVENEDGKYIVKKKKKITLINIIFLQIIVIVYTLSGVAGKYASGGDVKQFVFFYGIEVVILGVYALLWQQILKEVELSIAYANRSIALLWSMIWAAVLFHEKITVKNIIGVLIVIIGTIIVNSDNE